MAVVESDARLWLLQFNGLKAAMISWLVFSSQF